jgi:hypothetical protein
MATDPEVRVRFAALPLRLVSTIEELLGRKSSGSGLENREYGRRIRRADHVTPLYPQKVALTSPTNGGPLIGIVHSRAEAKEFSSFLVDFFKNSTIPY